MRIHAITLRPFRNFDQIDLSFEADRTLIVGGNGRGKSNILEAISYLSIGKSIRGARDRQAVPHGGGYFEISAACHDGRRDRHLRLFYADQDGKKAFCDGAPLPRVSDILGVFKSVHFSPEDVSLVLRFAAPRRRLLDILLSQSSASYLHDLQRYQRVLVQRNHFLRTRGMGAGKLDEEALQAWDVQFVRLGARIRLARLRALAEVEAPFEGYYRRFSDQQEGAKITYQGASYGRGAEEVEQERLRREFAAELEEKRARELRQGHSLSGPHRDQLVFVLEGKPAEVFASEGQLKTILTAWKMAELRFLEKQSGQQPVLLLDDVFSELDAVRSDKVLEAVDEFDQVLLTTPRESGPEFRGRFGKIRLGPN